jgi:hypothetical protein
MGISNAMVRLASDGARHGTGTTPPIDAGSTSPSTIPHL